MFVHFTSLGRSDNFIVGLKDDEESSDNPRTIIEHLVSASMKRGPILFQSVVTSIWAFYVIVFCFPWYVQFACPVWGLF
jgi:hypothetical protein